MKILLISVTLWSLAHAAYISRMTNVNRIRGPTPMRPGLMLQRPWPPRIIPAASHRSPYSFLYRNPPHRYAVKHVNPSATRSIYNTPWKTTARIPPLTSGMPDFEFIRAASSSPLIHTDGAIHTIPAPNLSLSEKPIVVMDSSESANNPSTEAPKPVYEVTENYSDSPMYQMTAKIEPPVGFSKTTSLNSPDFHSDLRNNVALQLASEYGIPLALTQASIVPQQFSVPGYNRMPTHQDLLHTGTEGIIIPPNALYQPDPMFLQKLQSQLLQQFPAVEFIPYAAPDYQQHSQTPTPDQTDLFLLENEQIIRQPPASFTPSEIHKNIVQRQTQEGTVFSLQPQGFSSTNATENVVDATTVSQPQNITVDLVTTEVTQSPTTTINYVVEANTDDQKTTPIYYAQIDQNVGNVIANGFYSAINDVRAAAALAQVEKAHEQTPAQPQNITSTTTSTIQPELKAYFVQNPNKANNETIGDLKPLHGVPFEKPAESVNVAYTLLRADKDKQPTATKDGVVYAGQLVEAKISEDQDFNKQKANIFARRPPLRLFAMPEKKTTEAPQKVTMVKAKIPPKSKLTFDDNTGEPVLRIYASYVDSPLQKEILKSKLANIKYINEAVTRKQDNFAAVKAVDKIQGSDKNQVTQFGLKLRSRSDDYIPLFEEYEE